MRALVREALQAGAAGFSTGRSDNHRTASGKDTPACEADAAELTGIVAAFDGLQHGVVQVVSDFDLMRGPQRFDAEFDLVEQLARASGRPLSMTWLQRDPGGEQWKQVQARVEAGVAAGLAAVPADRGARHRRHQRAGRELPPLHRLCRLQGDCRAAAGRSAPRRCASRRARR